jgi:6-phosphogluconate dehydrogenase
MIAVPGPTKMEMAMQAEIGLIGLGTMGANLALNIAEKGHDIAVFNRTTAKTGTFFEAAGEFVAAIRPPRPVILMIQAGDPVDEQIDHLRVLLSRDDIVIDAGNANFRDTMRRVAALEGSGLQFVGMGVSGGEVGARHGPSIMVGGEQASYNRIEPVLLDIAARYEGTPCCAWLGENGAGHFVKTIHNGIEYADMQMIAEIYGVMRDGFGMEPKEMAPIFRRWNEGPLDSYLIEITSKVLETEDTETAKPIVDVILDRAGQKGTGRWSAIEAQHLGVAATAIEAAVAARSLSALKLEREGAQKAYGAIGGKLERSDAFIDDLERALLAGKIAAYAQGFAVMAGASRDFKWNLPLPEVARIWRAGCIIRSAFLSTIASAFENADAQTNLLLVSEFVAIMVEAQASLRSVVARGAEAGLPMPALSSALSYFDLYRHGRGTANLIQGQRDFFGAHSFERIDQAGSHHGPWGIDAAH